MTYTEYIEIMKHFLVLLLLFTLSANSLAASKACMMDHNETAQSVTKMPCHDEVEEETQNAPHICDCDICSQFVYGFESSFVKSLQYGTRINIVKQLHSQNKSRNYRPPIYFSI
ncbi:hypothetical protein [uncultured Paraglaciecola sp.]|uniref:hypothetical protein n=1 Tax=uncultured Paraglaciecola sp. TaxID=1765024 RepID=UPI00263494D7|nr:hypothetical protein [uncultured Paraglaciecola sp.]